MRLRVHGNKCRPRVLVSSQHAVQQSIPSVREPVPSHGCHSAHENGGEDHVSLGSQRGQSTEDHPEEHLLQDLYFLILDVIKQALLMGSSCLNRFTYTVLTMKTFGTLAVERALLVYAELIQTWAHQFILTALINV